MARRKKTRSITIIGRRWFDRKNGNTYFSAVGLVNGLPVAHIEFAYGYSQMYEQEMSDAIERAGYMLGREHHKNGGAEAAWRYCQDRGIAYYAAAADVANRRDL